MANFSPASETRFSNCAENYVRYPPDYPPEILIPLCGESCLTKGSVVAHAGSGTGICTSPSRYHARQGGRPVRSPTRHQATRQQSKRERHLASPATQPPKRQDSHAEQRRKHRQSAERCSPHWQCDNSCHHHPAHPRKRGRADAASAPVSTKTAPHPAAGNRPGPSSMAG